jgi:hypothetical protein
VAIPLIILLKSQSFYYKSYGQNDIHHTTPLHMWNQVVEWPPH